MFWVTRNRRMERTAEKPMKAVITIPCTRTSSAPIESGKTKPRKAKTMVPVATMTSTPGHQAQKPAKNPQNGPKALFVQR